MFEVKQKTFIFNGYDLGRYNHVREEVDFDSSLIDRTVNSFLVGKELVDIKTTCFSRGNNPPTAGVVYTIIYKDNIKE